MVRGALLIAAVAAAIAVALSSSAASPVAHRTSTRALTRYSLVHGCYKLRARPGGTPIAAKRGPFRMQAAGLAHVTAFEFIGGDFHCGQPWNRYGAPYALPASCAHYEQGTNGAFESFLDFGGPTRPSDMHGWPTFREWPSPTALVEEGDYYTGIERAWKAGLRLM